MNACEEGLSRAVGTLFVDGAKAGVTAVSPSVVAPGKASVDPATAKLWTLSASDMNDEEMVCGFVCEALLFFLLSPFLLSVSVMPLGQLYNLGGRKACPGQSILSAV